MIESEISLICKSCQQLYTKKERCPRRLLCGHTLCTSCLANLIETKNRKCPSCVRPFLASSETQLPTDFSIYKQIAYNSPELETDSRKFSAANKFTLNPLVRANENRYGHINASKDQFQLSGQLGNLSNHYENQTQLFNNRRIVSPTSPTPFKYELPLIARSPSTMVRLPAYAGLGGYDEVDTPRERVQVEDISQEDIQTIPPPASTMYPLPATPITQLPQQTSITQRSSDQDASNYQPMQKENLNTISKDLRETPGSFQLPTSSIRNDAESHLTTQTPGIKPTFSNELPKPIKRSVTILSPPIPAARSSLTQQLTTKEDDNGNTIPDTTNSNSNNFESTPTQQPHTAITSNMLSNTDICDSGNSKKGPSYSSLKETQSAKWKPLSTSSPLSWEKTKLSSVGNITERLPITQKTTSEPPSENSSNSKVITLNTRATKGPAQNPKALKRDPLPASTLSEGTNKLLNSNEVRVKKSSTKPRAPNPKVVSTDLPSVYSPILYRPSNATSFNSTALDLSKLTGEGIMIKNSKRKAPNPAIQQKSARQELSLDKSTPISNTNSQEQSHSDPQISKDQKITVNNDVKQGISRQHIQPEQCKSDQITSDKNQLPDTSAETFPVIQIQSPQKPNMVATTLPLGTTDSKTPKAAITENIIERIRVPTPPSPSTIPESSEDDKKDLNESLINSKFTANESVQRTYKSEMHDDNQGSKPIYKLGVGPVPFKSDEDSTYNMITSDKSGIHSQYVNRMKRGELQVGEVPSVQEFESDRNLANTPESIQEQNSTSSFDTLQNSHKFKTEKTSEPSKFPRELHQMYEEPVKRYISPLTKRVDIFPSHDDFVKQESVMLKYSKNNESLKLNEGNKERYPLSRKVEVNICKGNYKSSNPTKPCSDNSFDENLTHDDEFVDRDDDTEEAKTTKDASYKEEITRSIPSISFRKYSSQKIIIQENVIAELQPKSNHSRDMKSEVKKSHSKLVAKSDNCSFNDHEEVMLSATEEQSDDITKPHEKYHKNVRSDLVSNYSSNGDEERVPKSNKHKVLTRTYKEQQRTPYSASKRMTGCKSNENYIRKEQTEKQYKQHKRKQVKTQMWRELKKPTSLKNKQDCKDGEVESETIDIKFQRAHHRLKSTIDEPKSPPSYKEKKTGNGKTSVPMYLTRKNNDGYQRETKLRTEGRVKDQELSESHSDISERIMNKNIEECSNSESDSIKTGSEGEMKINSKGMIVRYPTGYKSPKSDIKNYYTESTSQTCKQKNHYRHGKHSGQKNLLDNYLTESADEITINRRGMIMRIPSSSRRQASQKEKEKIDDSSDTNSMNQDKNRHYQKMHYSETESGETSDSDKSSKTRRDNDWNTSIVNLLLQRARRSLKSTLDDVISKEQTKPHSTQKKSGKKASTFKEHRDSDGENKKPKNSKSRTGKEYRVTSNESKVRESENFTENYPASMPYATLSDMYKYDERIPKRFYSRADLKSSNNKSIQDRKDNYQQVMNPAFKYDDETVSESENQNSEEYLKSSKYEAQKRRKEAIMPKYQGLEGNTSVSSEEFPTDIYADFKPDKNKNKASLSNDDDSDMPNDTTRKKGAKSSITKSNSFLKRRLALTDSQYKSSFHYRPSSQIYTAELALVTNPEDGKTEHVKDLEKEMKSMGVGLCTTHGALMDLYCKTCELWVCQECLDVVHRPPPEGHCQTISSDQAVEELKESHAELFDAKIATLEHFKEELQKLLENCEKSIKDHEISIAQLSSRVLSEKMIIQGIENMKNLVQQKWKQVEQWEDVLEGNALRIGQSGSSKEIVDAMQKNKSEILVHVMQGMTGEKVPNQTTNHNLW